MEKQDGNSGSSAVMTIIVMVVPAPRQALRAEDTTPSWDDLVPDSEPASIGLQPVDA